MNPVWGITLKGMEALRVEVEAEITGGLFAISQRSIENNYFVGHLFILLVYRLNLFA